MTGKRRKPIHHHVVAHWKDAGLALAMITGYLQQRSAHQQTAADVATQTSRVDGVAAMCVNHEDRIDSQQDDLKSLKLELLQLKRRTTTLERTRGAAEKDMRAGDLGRPPVAAPPDTIAAAPHRGLLDRFHLGWLNPFRGH